MSQTALQAVVDHVVDGIITINEQGIIETFNPAAERIFGYKAEEVIGRNVNMLMPEPYHSQHDTYLRELPADRARRRSSASAAKWRAGARTARTFPMDLAVSEFHLGAGACSRASCATSASGSGSSETFQFPGRRQRLAGRAGGLREHAEESRPAGRALLRRLVHRGHAGVRRVAPPRGGRPTPTRPRSDEAQAWIAVIRPTRRQSHGPVQVLRTGPVGTDIADHERDAHGVRPGRGAPADPAVAGDDVGDERAAGVAGQGAGRDHVRRGRIGAPLRARRTWRWPRTWPTARPWPSRTPGCTPK